MFKLFQKNRQQLIESLEFSFFLYEITISFGINYRKTTNPLIKLFFKLVTWWRDWEFAQVQEYNQLLTDHPYWQSRHYYYERIEKFISNDISIEDFIPEILYLGLSNKKEASALLEDFQRQANIELDPKSFGFSKIISDLIPLLEGFDKEPEESLFSEKEFRKIIENLAVKLEKYPIK